jgi:beta-phosphoglucomutase-like phosphatase (HAD superfamily)
MAVSEWGTNALRERGLRLSVQRGFAKRWVQSRSVPMPDDLRGGTSRWPLPMVFITVARLASGVLLRNNEQAVMFEEQPAGLEAQVDAGMQACVRERGHHDP